MTTQTLTNPSRAHRVRHHAGWLLLLLLFGIGDLTLLFLVAYFAARVL